MEIEMTKSQRMLRILCIIGIVLNAINGDISSNRFFSFFFDLILLFLANEVKKQA